MQAVGNNKVESIWYNLDNDTWYHGFSNGKDDRKNAKFYKKGHNSVNTNNIITQAPIGTRVNLFSEFLKGTVFEKENILKVGDDQYLAQGLGDGVLTMQEVKEALVSKAYGNKLTSTERAEKVSSIKVIDIEYSSERDIVNKPEKK